MKTEQYVVNIPGQTLVVLSDTSIDQQATKIASNLFRSIGGRKITINVFEFPCFSDALLEVAHQAAAQFEKGSSILIVDRIGTADSGLLVVPAAS